VSTRVSIADAGEDTALRLDGTPLRMADEPSIPAVDKGREAAHARRPLFLRWAVFQSAVLTLLVAAALAYGDRLHGASLIMVPLILLVLAGASGYAGYLAWQFDGGASPNGGLRHLWFAAGVCQLLGLLGTVAGFYTMFNGPTADGSGAPGGSDLATRVTQGAGVALSATFIGILSSIVILVEHHVLDRET
jgi:hypothetical protein